MTDAWWIDWIPWRAFVGLLAAYAVVASIYILIVNPEIIRHRMVPKGGTEPWDWVFFAVFNTALIATFVVANLDIRSGWAPLPLWAWQIGVVLFVLGGGLFARAMGENPFFEKTVRIQSERGHHVIDTGPYRTVRHPGYVGLLAFILSLPLLLTSTWALLPTALALISLTVRTGLEDRTLREKLPGYADYAARIRFRLIPGVW